MTDQNSQERHDAELEYAFSRGVGAGCTGCQLIILLSILGRIGGVAVGGYAFDWYYAGKKVDPLLGMSWAFRGGVLGLCSGLVLALIGWGASMMPKPK